MKANKRITRRTSNPTGIPFPLSQRIYGIKIKAAKMEKKEWG
jgi:hypothetical protein